MCSLFIFVHTAVESTSSAMDEPQEAQTTEAAGQQEEAEGTAGAEGESTETDKGGENVEDKGTCIRYPWCALSVI